MRQHANVLTQDEYTAQTRVVDDYRYSAVSVTYAINPTQHVRPRDAPQGRVLSILIATSRQTSVSARSVQVLMAR